MVEGRDLHKASQYVNNLLLARGLLRHGKAIDFVPLPPSSLPSRPSQPHAGDAAAAAAADNNGSADSAHNGAASSFTFPIGGALPERTKKEKKAKDGEEDKEEEEDEDSSKKDARPSNAARKATPTATTAAQRAARHKASRSVSMPVNPPSLPPSPKRKGRTASIASVNGSGAGAVAAPAAAGAGRRENEGERGVRGQPTAKATAGKLGAIGAAEETMTASEAAAAQIINLVHDMIIRRDRDAEGKEQLATTIHTLEAAGVKKDQEIERLQARVAELDRHLALAHGQEQSLKRQVRAAENAARSVREEMTRLRGMLQQERTQRANDLRERDAEIKRLRARLDAKQRGTRAPAAPSLAPSQVSPPPTATTGATLSAARAATPAAAAAAAAAAVVVAGSATAGPPAMTEERSINGTSPTAPQAVSLDSPDYHLSQESSEFLAQLCLNLNEENDALTALVQSSLARLQEIQGFRNAQVALGNGSGSGSSSAAPSGEAKPSDSNSSTQAADGAGAGAGAGVGDGGGGQGRLNDGRGTASGDGNSVTAAASGAAEITALPLTTAAPIASCKALAHEMRITLDYLQQILTNPSFVPLEEVEIREAEIARLRHEWRRMDARWRSAVAVMEAWRGRIADDGTLVGVDNDDTNNNDDDNDKADDKRDDNGFKKSHDGDATDGPYRGRDDESRNDGDAQENSRLRRRQSQRQKLQRRDSDGGGANADSGGSGVTGTGDGGVGGGSAGKAPRANHPPEPRATPKAKPTPTPKPIPSSRSRPIPRSRATPVSATKVSSAEVAPSVASSPRKKRTIK